MLKKILFILIVTMGIGSTYALAPSYDRNFADYLTSDTPDQYGRVETVFSICIDKNKTLMQNVKNLFYPSKIPGPCSSSPGGQLWDVIRVLGFAVLFIFLVMAGVDFIMKIRDAEGPKKAGMSIIYIAYGAFLVFGVTWILGSVLNIGGLQGTTELVQNVQNKLFLQVLSFFKVLAFFAAILMVVVYGFRIMASMDQSDKIKTLQKGLMNVFIALILIKVIDYVYYIAQSPDFGAKASTMVIDIAKILGFILGGALVLAIFYAGFLLITSSGKEETFKKATGFIVNVVIVSIVVFLFLLIVYQIFKEFT